MKILRVLLIAAFLFSAFATSAQAPGKALGFVPLLTRADPNIPIQLQTQDALNPMLGSLLAAQKRGEIIKFAPSLATGVLKVVYRASANTAALFGGRPVYADMREAVASMNLPKQVFSRPHRASGPGTQAAGYFNVFLYDTYFSGYSLPANAHVIGSLRDTTGVVVSVFEGDVDSAGDLDGYFTWAGSYADVIPGYRVIFKVYSGATLLSTLTAVAPRIKFSTIDKATSIVTGTGPAGKSFWAYWQHRNWNAANDYIFIDKSGTFSSTGAWSADFGTTPLRGNDGLGIWAFTTPNFAFGRFMDVPYIYCEIGSNYCSLYGFPSKPAALSIVHGGVTYNFTGKFSPWGSFYGELTTADGDPIFLKAGDKASGTGVALWALPNLTAAINYTTNVVSGKAMANKYFYVEVYRPYTGYWYYKYLLADALGNYSADFTSSIDLKPTQPVVVDVYVVNPATGNAVDIYKSFGP